MGSVNSNFLPASTGLSLGNQNQQWDTFIRNLTLSGKITAPGVGFSSVTYVSTPVFDGSQGSTFEIVLTGNVTSSTSTNLIAGYKYIFIILQDVTGGRTFAWPAGFFGTMVIDQTPSVTNVQEFVYDGSSMFAVSAGVAM